ncbi:MULTISPECIES: trigger factor [Brucella]|nr:trigger factor [Brucella ceti B1/94]EEZ08506.1 trigger factor [Brucella ceti M490/95/1]ENT10230.1 trigger factor [Brucella sp. F23/97]ENT17230.1 trigger factor [Brucella sp. F96/2]ENT23360.1 trigger factor [Brucella sp. UK1/97]
MQVTETLNEGLKREIKVVVPAGDLEAKLAERLETARGRARINGFRPGKVPTAHLRKMYGKSFMAEIVNEILNDSSRSILAERNEKSATQPEVIMSEDEKEAEKVLDGKADFVFSLNYEVLPAIEVKDFSKIAVTREVVDISDEEVDEQVKRIASSTRTFETKKGKAENEDRVTIDYLGKLDGEPFEGGADNDAQLVLGSGQFIPGFEEQLIGLKAGDEKVITVTFPAEYGAAHLAGKEATFDIKVKEVAKPNELVLDDETAKKLGIESLERLRQVVREQIESQYGQITRQKVKRQILDALDGDYQFETPQKLVDAEFNNIWQQINFDLQQAGRTFEDEETTEEAAREEYRKLAERRVRLGLVLSEIGEKAGVEVTEEELQRAVYDQVRRYPGQEKEIYDFLRRTPDAVANLRAPIFEEKVVDHLLANINVTDKKVSKEELTAEDEDAASEAKPAKKAAAKKKAAPKKASPKRLDWLPDDQYG